MDGSIELIAMWVLAANLASIGLYAWDKGLARERARGKSLSRIPEQMLLTVDFAGGFPGGFWAQRRFRHKTRKGTFQAKWMMVATASTVAWGVLLYGFVAA
ncbi:protein of unknown function DUF1294 (plasmid) [Thioalkalivibrio sp. K90mix]|uniref:DUF1294 domain-containing protein n=1 Tax=Thioalkalivibrio sp. (strain K90mix) TaxID=396595 RepID=UPI000195A716|nr:DUF1294 domain-containing protein [Thioalkalivibrio sp. K90mix]ADC73276.1 protein of unknown function DUF1294 [Thioalkalivibrio sp. K90mix]